MTRHYTTLLDQQRGHYRVIVDKTWEDLHPNDLFDESVTDIQEICKKIDSGHLDWFMLRVRVTYEGVELHEDYVGGFLYEDAEEVLKDGTAEDVISCALDEANKAAAVMKQKFAQLDLAAV